jgi:hypothetical protein
VTYYHKGYSVTGTTKIIHRYLSSNVGELLLYYVWLIVPFLSQLSQLVKIPGFKQGSTPYLWGEFSISQLLSSGNTKVQTLPYLQAKFKRDFIEAVSWAWNDEMAAHSTKIAGLTYARGLEEAPGHIAGAKAEYRRISREWHAWLGFGGFRNSAI